MKNYILLILCSCSLLFASNDPAVEEGPTIQIVQQNLPQGYAIYAGVMAHAGGGLLSGEIRFAEQFSFLFGLGGGIPQVDLRFGWRILNEENWGNANQDWFGGALGIRYYLSDAPMFASWFVEYQLGLKYLTTKEENRWSKGGDGYSRELGLSNALAVGGRMPARFISENMFFEVTIGVDVMVYNHETAQGRRWVTTVGPATQMGIGFLF